MEPQGGITASPEELPCPPTPCSFISAADSPVDSAQSDPGSKIPSLSIERPMGGMIGCFDDQDYIQEEAVEEIVGESYSNPAASSTYGGSDAVYSALYSSVAVYEMICRDIAVMRRQKDSFMNATQVLKVANIDKGKRTKILEKEISNKLHEKVQGGNGKYQGTWCGV